MNKEKYIDESWKESAASEKTNFTSGKADESQEESGCGHEECGCSHDHHHDEADAMEINFLNYVTSLGYQAMIFLGLIPNPMTNEAEKNLQQAKFLIDTLVMMREKTKGNLNKQEDDLLNASIYELQLRFVEITEAESKKNA